MIKNTNQSLCGKTTTNSHLQQTLVQLVTPLPSANNSPKTKADASASYDVEFASLAELHQYTNDQLRERAFAEKGIFEV